MFYHVKNLFLSAIILLYIHANAETISEIQIFNGKNQAHIIFNFMGNYKCSFLQINRKQGILDITQNGIIQGLPLQFSGNNLIKNIRLGTTKHLHTLRLIFEFTRKHNIHILNQKKGVTCSIFFIVKNDKFLSKGKVNSLKTQCLVTSNVLTNIPNHSSIFFKNKKNNFPVVTRNNITERSVKHVRKRIKDKIIIAIDAGHGGQDSGAIGFSGTREKNITIAITSKLCALLDGNPMFRGVMIRKGDYFVSVIGRSDIARKQNANLLVSIHADSAPNRNANGASVWMLSNRRANREIANWLEKHEKQYEFFSSTENILKENKNDLYLNQTVLDLKFGYSQRISYNVAVHVLNQLENVVLLHKNHPEYASFGVLRAPDIPSILIETGFISNIREERMLSNTKYQEQIAKAIYKGLSCYFKENACQFLTKNNTC